MNDLLNDLKEQQLIETQPADILSNAFDSTIIELVKNEFQNQSRDNKGHRYSETVKQFALTLFYYSPQAYDYCRTILSLPHPSSLRNWLSNVNAEPGFLTDVIDIAAKSEDREYCLIVDSMSIRKQTIYQQGSVSGFCDYGGVLAEDRDRLASEALVFILVPFKGVSRQYIIGYFLVDKISSQVQAELIKSALILTASKGLRVRSITCDGCSSNTSTLKLLGGSLQLPNPSPVFDHPTLDCKIYLTLDICHMIKLARNALAEFGSFRDSDGHKISWHYITDLVDLQDKMGIHLGNKLSSAHVNWEKAKMKVKLAAQVFSTSVADALQFLHQQKVSGYE